MKNKKLAAAIAAILAAIVFIWVLKNKVGTDNQHILPPHIDTIPTSDTSHNNFPAFHILYKLTPIDSTNGRGTINYVIVKIDAQSDTIRSFTLGTESIFPFTIPTALPAGTNKLVTITVKVNGVEKPSYTDYIKLDAISCPNPPTSTCNVLTLPNSSGGKDYFRSGKVVISTDPVTGDMRSTCSMVPDTVR